MVDRERDAPGGARLQRHPLEAAEAAYGLGEARHGVVQVELYDVVTGPVAGVGQRHRGPHLAVAADRGVVEREVADGEGRVAEPEPEGVQRVAGAEVAVARVVLL